MFTDIKYEDLRDKLSSGEYILIDVRTPLEYKEETIPGAINIPIFTNEERAEIGTAYAQESVDKAKMLGIEAVSKRLPQMFQELLQISKDYPHMVFFCARGGFRSTSIVSLLRSLKIGALKLDGGYKAYRAYINDNLPKIAEPVDLVVLYGNTGTGKTQVLDALRAQGADVLDLEACANHRGSTLGSVGLGEPNSQKMFESLVFEELAGRKGNLVFAEGESKRIGRSVIPEYLFDKIRNGRHVRVTAPMEQRIKNIMADYVYDTDDELIEALNHLRKRVGNDVIDKYIIEVRNGNYPVVVEELMRDYYDPMYEHNPKNYVFEVENLDPEETARNLIERFLNSQFTEHNSQ
ncbi:tRNA 2-selenouridine(34) synthase MnmH [Gudongella oleilytica]|jgi:tRNA 2-selenouridine synthase|uniref:tRNA 2-selenouridine(34) synthase MnmH n=1 Tax=Gudongella oleilytica TaxID=1582259 RepID=UPI000FF88012|nr:tRNA 2-selenouridine(34) synthase MnmH [Gudongella oleilytica]